MPKLGLLLLCFACALINSGCVVGRRSVELPVPSLGGNAVTKGEIYIGNITDDRRFENKPAAPSTPSIDGDINSASAELRSTLIGRQRNGFGKAMGDIALPANDSVKQRARVLFEEGLKRRGYQVVKDANAANSAEISIQEFWAWFTPGMWSVSFEAKVTCTITLKRSGVVSKLIINGYGNNQGQVASNANWQLAYTRAFTDFLQKN